MNAPRIPDRSTLKEEALLVAPRYFVRLDTPAEEVALTAARSPGYANERRLRQRDHIFPR